jgi:hypothetical protein
MPRKDSSSIRSIIASSSSFVRFFRFGSQSRRGRRLVRRSWIVVLRTLYTAAARFSL